MFNCEPRQSTFCAILSLRDGFPGDAPPTCRDVLWRACTALDVSRKHILAQNRFGEWAPRRMAIYFVMSKWTGKGPTEIGRMMNRDHSTVSKCLRKVSDNLDGYAKHIAMIEARLGKQFKPAADHSLNSAGMP